MMQPIFIQNYALCNVLGSSKDEIWYNLSHQQNFLTCDNEFLQGKETFIGRINITLPEIPDRLSAYRCRNNQVVLWCLQQIEKDISNTIAHYGRERVAVVMGTSTAGIDFGEKAIIQWQNEGCRLTGYDYRCQELGSISGFVQNYLGLRGIHFTVSTACSSSARAFISAQRLLYSDLADAVIVGGADTLCHLTLNGFDALSALSSSLCQPFSSKRNGINIGEAGALFLLTREPSSLALVGAGESSDAYHISAPAPDGKGAVAAMHMALRQAGLLSQEIGYLNLHGTATSLNDSMESIAVSQVFGSVPCSSTKYLTGHTLGAAGATEAALSCLILQRCLTDDTYLPIQYCDTSNIDQKLPKCGLITEPVKLASPYVMSNSFAFGGNNCSLIFHFQESYAGRCRKFSIT